MTSLVVSAPTPEISLLNLIYTDGEVASGKKGEVTFYILGAGTPMPKVLKSLKNRHLKRSAVELPADEESVNKFRKVFEELVNDLQLIAVKICDIDKGTPKETAVIFYSVKPLR